MENTLCTLYIKCHITRSNVYILLSCLLQPWELQSHCCFDTLINDRPKTEPKAHCTTKVCDGNLKSSKLLLETKACSGLPGEGQVWLYSHVVRKMLRAAPRSNQSSSASRISSFDEPRERGSTNLVWRQGDFCGYNLSISDLLIDGLIRDDSIDLLHMVIRRVYDKSN